MPYVLTTTYRNDFIAPVSASKYIFNSPVQKTGILCNECKGKQTDGQINPQKNWTGCGLMGRFLLPSIYPLEEDKQVTDNISNEKSQKQPESIVDVKTYKCKACNRLFTTYQSDYCGNQLTPQLIAKEIVSENKSSSRPIVKINNFEELDCKEVKTASEETLLQHLGECEAIYKPLKISFADAPNVCGKTDVYWYPKSYAKPNSSEYRDVISRTGCIITENRLHNHKKCIPGKECTHVLKENCATYS